MPSSRAGIVERHAWVLCGRAVRVASAVPLPALLVFALRRHARPGAGAVVAVDLRIRRRVFTRPESSCGTAVRFDRPLMVHGEIGPRRYWLSAGEGGVVGDLRSGRAVVDAPSTAWLAEPSVLRTLMPLALTLPLQRCRSFLVHAAVAVDPAGEGWLLCGGSGAGKSTTLVALVARGWRYLGDDAVLLRETRRGVEALAFWDELRLDRRRDAPFCHLRFVDLRADHPTKGILDVGALSASAYQARVGLRHLVWLSRRALPPGAGQWPGARYLGHLVSENAVLLVHSPRQQLRLLARLVETCSRGSVRSDARLLEEPGHVLAAAGTGGRDRERVSS